ncbi:MAG: type II secretion system F family protein, partial [Planctomycetaceae bacterium]|nr:type II secretion system F family protein [Planctomycetaceae bacterium]
YGKVSDAIREGEPIAQPLKQHSRPTFHPMALFFYAFFGAFPGIVVTGLHGATPDAGLLMIGGYMALAGGVLLSLFYLARMRQRVVDDLVVNMVDVGEETGELDTMLYKVADQYDEEVKVLTDGLMALLEPLLIVFLGLAVGFIVVSLFLPLVELIQKLSG